MSQVIDASDGSWADKFQTNDSPVIAHTPDATRYHAPNSPELIAMGEARGGGTIIPRANDDGTSKGFDANVAGAVRVDPNAPDGGAFIDLRKVNKEMVETARSHSSSPAHAFYNLQALSQQADEIRRSQQSQRNPQKPGYVVPRANTDGLPVETQAGTVHLASQRAHPIPASQHIQQGINMSQQIPPAYLPPPPQLQPSEAPQPVYSQSPGPRQIQEQLAQLTGLVAQLAERQISAAPPPSLQNHASLPEPVSMTATAVAPSMPPTSTTEPRPGEYTGGFESLQIPFLTDPTGHRPDEQVVFDMPGLGTTSSRYHQIIDVANYVVLVYDTRFEDGVQFAPPDQSTVEDPKPFSLTIRKNGTQYSVNSVGIQFTLGVLDVIVLVKAGAEHG